MKKKDQEAITKLYVENYGQGLDEFDPHNTTMPEGPLERIQTSLFEFANTVENAAQDNESHHLAACVQALRTASHYLAEYLK